MGVVGCMDPAGSRYAQAVARLLAGELGANLTGVWLYGSSVVGEFVAGHSDVDVVAVCERAPDEAGARALLDRLWELPRPWPTKGLDLWLVPRASAERPTTNPEFVFRLITQIESELHGGPDHPGDQRLVMMFAQCRAHGLCLIGPPAPTVFRAPEREWLIDAMVLDLSLRAAPPHYRVLNACRTWHFADTGVLCPKLTGARWARARTDDSALVDAAVEWHRSGAGPLIDPSRVDAFVGRIARRLRGGGPGGLERVPLEDGRSPRRAAPPPPERPLVSCLLDRPASREVLRRSVDCFVAQDYPDRELIVLEDRERPVGDVLATDPRVRRVTLERPLAAAERRAVATNLARGTMLAAWDPDAWYAPWRLSFQVAEVLRSGRDRVVSASLLRFDPHARRATHHEDAELAAELLERTTLCAMRRGWPTGARGAARSERSDFCVLVAEDAPPGPDDPPDTTAHIPYRYTEDTGVRTFPLKALRTIMGDDLDTYPVGGAHVAMREPTPLVSCLMPTYNRRPFVRQAVHYFLRQDWPACELVVVDDGSNPVADLMPRDDRVRYHRLLERSTIGAKRNLACRLANGEYMVQWDDDDWFGPGRVRRQVADLVAGRADMSGIMQSYLLDIRTTRFYEGLAQLHTGVLHSAIATGTLAFSAAVWRECGGYPDRSMGEEVALLYRGVDRGARVAPIDNQGVYVYVRHGANSWRLDFAVADGPAGWKRTGVPPFVPREDVDVYRALAGRAQAEAVA